MDVDCGYDWFDLPISEVLQNQHLGILGMLCLCGWEHILSRQIYPLIKSKHSLENVTRLITEKCNLVDNSYQYVW